MSAILEDVPKGPLRASNYLGLQQWLLWADEEGFITLRYTSGEVVRYFLHRLIGFPADPARRLRGPEEQARRCRRVPRSHFDAVRVLFRGTPLLELRSTLGRFRWFWLHDGSVESARLVCKELFSDIYAENGFGRLSRILTVNRRPDV